MDPIAAEIQAEIDDHLATAAEQLQSQGITTDAALRKSQQKFGDAAAIGRRCYWIKQGDALMFRTAVILLLSILCLALGATVFTSWRAQRQTAEQMALLAEQLKALAEQQRPSPTLSPAAEPQPLEITGNLFIGSPDKPSANTEVMICRVGDGEVVRRVTTKDDGTFQTGPIVAGDYTLVAKGVKPPGAKAAMGLQTAPIYLYPGQTTPNVAMDVKYRCGQLRLKLPRPLPDLKVEGKYLIASRLYLSVRPSDTAFHATRWTTASPTPDHWPMLIRSPESPPPPVNPPKDYESVRFGPTYAITSADDLKKSDLVEFKSDLNPLPAGPCSLLAVVVADVMPAAPFDLDEIVGRGYARNEPRKTEEWLGDYWVRYRGKGALWHTLLLDRTRESGWAEADRRARDFGGRLSSPERSDLMGSSDYPPSVYRGAPLVSDIVIGDGLVTNLEIEVPSDMLARIQHLVEDVPDPDAFLKAVKEEKPFIRTARITVLGTEPLRLGDGASQ